jgi:hypothetical protein
LPAIPKVNRKTGVLLVPSRRIDGSSEDPPWTVPEPILWDLLRKAEIEHVEERHLDGLNSSFWARYRNKDGRVRSALLKFGGLGRDHVYEVWGTRFMLDPGHYDVLRRELAAYEAAKACGMEDMVAPVAAREVNLVPLISDAVRSRISSAMRVPSIEVDERLGTVGLLQALPFSASNFVEFWGTLGADEATRWERASDRLRHSIYRAIAFDFLTGSVDRLLCSILYNRTSDALVLYDNALVFSDPVATADAYIQARLTGWGKRATGPTEDSPRPVPVHGADLLHLSALVQDAYVDECAQTFGQIAEGMTDELALLLGQVLIEHSVPPRCIAGFFARMTFMQEDPEAVLARPEEFTRNVLVPMRRGYGFGEGRNQKVVEVVNSIMSAATGAAFDFAKNLQAKQ